MIGGQESDKRALYEQIVQETQGLQGGDLEEYYDSNPGSLQIVRELRGSTSAREALEYFDKGGKRLVEEMARYEQAVDASGLRIMVEDIYAYTDDLGSEEYVEWLEAHPFAKGVMQRVAEVQDRMGGQ